MTMIVKLNELAHENLFEEARNGGWSYETYRRTYLERLACQENVIATRLHSELHHEQQGTERMMNRIEFLELILKHHGINPDAHDIVSLEEEE